MAKKNAAVRKIDQRTTVTGAPVTLLQETGSEVRNIREIPAPEDLTVTGQVVAHSAQSAQVWINVEWEEPAFSAPDAYLVEYGLQSAYNATTKQFSESTKVRVQKKNASLLANQKTNYYIRVQAIVGTVLGLFTEVEAVTTIADATPAPDITSLAADFTTGNLVITWTEPESDIFKDAQIQIWNAARTVLYGTYYSATGKFIWTEAENLRTSSGTGVTSVLVEVASRSWSNTLGNVVDTTETLTAPTAVTSVVSNFTGSSLLLSWTNPNAQYKDIEIKIYDDNTKVTLYRTVYVQGNSYVWTFEQNAQDTSGSPDPDVYYEIKVRSWLNLASSSANGTAVNLEPSTSDYSVSVAAGFATMSVTIALLAPILDISKWNIALYDGNFELVEYVITTAYTHTFKIPFPGDYFVQAYAIDIFEQYSDYKESDTIYIDTLTIEELRTNLTYSDSVATPESTLRRLKDGTLYSSGSGSYVFYGSSATWKSISAERAILDRYKVITFSAFWAPGTQIYFETYDGTNTNYYAAPVTISGASFVRQLTKYTSSATAKANAYAFATSSNGTLRFELPAITEAREVKLHFVSPSGSFGLFEFYPRRLVQSDDIEAETIKALNIAAGAITADKISVVQLSAITAQMGALTMDGVITIASGGGIYQGGGSFNSPTTGLKLFNSGVIGKLSTYKLGVEQVTFDTDGIFKGGAGKVQISASGVRLEARGFDYFSGVQYNVAANPNNIVWLNPVSGANLLTIEGYLRNYPTGGPDGFTGGVPQSIIQHVGTGTGSGATELGGIDFVIIDTTPGVPKGSSEGFRFKGANVTIEEDLHASKNIYADGIVVDEIDTPIMISTSAIQIKSDVNVQFYVTGTQRGYFTDTAFQSNVPARVVYTTALTNTTSGLFTMQHLTSGTPAAGFGVDLIFYAHSANNTVRQQFLQRSTWVTATDASRTSRVQFFVYDATNAREVLRMESSGSAAMLGFFAVASVVRQTGGAATADLTYDATERDMINRMYTALRNYGLLT